jgi:predicted CXXCH cytochrome family protein
MSHIKDAVSHRGFMERLVAVAALVLIGCGDTSGPGIAPLPLPAAMANTAAIQDGYVGAAACAECHAEESAAWKSSRHNAIFRPGAAPAWKTSPPPEYSSAALVVAPLPDGGGLQVRKGGAVGTYPIDGVIGGERMESYVTHLKDGAWLLLPLSYQVQSRTFVPYSEGTCGIEFLYTIQEGRWQSFERAWNHRCIDCHTTAGSIGFHEVSQEYNTTYVDDGAACEACHGPGSDHVKAARAGDVTAGAIVNPGDLSAAGSMEICASCHALSLPFESRWGGNRPYRPGDDWSQAYLPLLRPTEEGSFARLTHADHTPAAGVMEYQGLIQSRCYLEGNARCTTCHNSHGGGDHLLKTAAGGSALCADCHAKEVAAGEAHTHHPAGRPGSNCIDCHMPTDIKALGTRLASHAIDVPLPVNNVEFGIPDACSLCHGDRGVDWADARYRELWGDPESRRRRRLTVAFMREDVGALGDLLQDPDESPLLRADAASALARIQRVDAVPALVTILDQDAPLLLKRYAVDLLGGMGAPADLPFQARADHLQKVEDAGAHGALRRVCETGVPVLRLGAASSLARLGAEDGLRQLEALLDEPVLAGGYRLHQALAKYNLLTGRLDKAAAAFETVLTMTPNYLDAIQDLGFVYFSAERFQEARDLWMRGLILDPENKELRLRVHLAEDEMRKHGLLPPAASGG